MDNFNLRKFLTENKLTKVSKLTETMHGSVDPAISNDVYGILKSYDDNDDPELGHWKQDPTNVLEQIIEILQENGIEVPSGMFHDRMYQAVDELVRHTRDLQFIADSLIEFVLDPGMYQGGMNEQADELGSDSGYKFTIDDGEDVSKLVLQDYPDLDTALYDVVQDLASTYNGSVRKYLNNVEVEAQYGSFSNLQELLDYEVDNAGGMERVLQNGLHLIMPGTAMDEVFIKITPLSAQ